MSKKVKINARPKSSPELDQWVETRDPVEPPSKPTVKPKRLTIDIDPDLHRQLKISCATRDIQIADLLRTLIERDLRNQESSSITD